MSNRRAANRKEREKIMKSKAPGADKINAAFIKRTKIKIFCYE